MRAPLLLDLPQPTRRPHSHGGVAASAEPEQEQEVSHASHGHSQPRLALYASTHSRTGRPRFVGPAPQPTWGERIRNRIRRLLGKEPSP